MKTINYRGHSSILDPYHNNVIHHEKFSKTKNRILQFIQTAPSGSIAFVTGPTGIGKSTLLKRVTQEMNTALKLDNNLYPDLHPILDVEIVPPDSGSFNWRDCYIRILDKLGEPLVLDKNIVDHDLKKIIKKMSLSNRQFYSPQYRFAIEKCLQHKQPVGILFDEGQHFTKISSGRRLQDQLDTIKSIANITKTTIILFGTYELLDMANLNGQLARRTEIIHFDRYRYEIDNDLNSFVDLANATLTSLPINHEIDPVENVDYLYINSLGCGGILKEWIGNAANNALLSNRKSLKPSHLEEAQFSDRALIRIASEIKQGEEYLEPKDTGLIQECLGLNIGPLKASKTQQTNQKPGKRKPGRDLIKA